jgi:hypothetical protein
VSWLADAIVFYAILAGVLSPLVLLLAVWD